MRLIGNRVFNAFSGTEEVKTMAEPLELAWKMVGVYLAGERGRIPGEQLQPPHR